MSRLASHAVAWQFETDRFDRSSDLPDHVNAGNRFYGADLARFLADALGAAGLPSVVLDEDWGWMVAAARGSGADHAIGVYHLTEDDEASDAGDDRATWGLWLRRYEVRRALGFVPRRVEVEVGPQLAEAVRTALAREGIEVRPWDDPA